MANHKKYLASDKKRTANVQRLDENALISNQTAEGPSVIEGTDSYDQLIGTDGDDVLIGHGDFDYLEGGAGNDTYLFNIGDGGDFIYDTSGIDTIQFGEGITLADVEFSRSTEHTDLIITLLDDNGGPTEDKLFIVFALSDSAKIIELVKFADGSSVSFEDISDLLVMTASIEGTDEGESLFGTSEDDVLIGHGGDDYLDGGAGNDTYQFNVGDGRDVIIETSGTDKILFGAGITQAHVHFTRSDQHSDLFVELLDDHGAPTGDLLIIADARDTEANTIESVEFAAGTTLSFAEISALAAIIEGTDEGESLFGTSEDDVLIGRGGDDELHGFGGNDTYQFNVGDGRDVIIETSGTDKILFGAGITQAHVHFTRSDQHSDLFVELLDDHGAPTGDLLIIADARDTEANTIESVEFADGSSLNFAEISALAAIIEGTDEEESLFGTSEDDVLIGRGGNDELHGFDGNDTYQFNIGDGRDVIIETSGTDKILFGAGITQTHVHFTRSDQHSDLFVELLDDNGAPTGDQLIIADARDTEANTIESVEFADGTTLSFAEISALAAIIEGTDEGESLFGTSEDDVLIGRGGDDSLEGGAGNDTLYGGSGDDKLYGGIGDDYLVGGEGDDYLLGGAGNDVLLNVNGNGYFEGGLGDDKLISGDFGNGFGFNSGDGHDTLSSSGSLGYENVIRFGDVSSDQLLFCRDGMDMMLINNNGSDSIRIEQWFAGAEYQIEYIWLEDRAYFNVEELSQAVNTTVEGTVNSDILSGAEAVDDHLSTLSGNDVIHGLGGDDYLHAGDGDDILYGGTGNDWLIGAKGADVLDSGRGDDRLYGGAGNDILIGGHGSDEYRFKAGSGHDTLLDDGAVTDIDTIILQQYEFNPEDMRVSRNGDDLFLSHSGGVNTLRIEQWFKSVNFQVEKILFESIDTMFDPEEGIVTWTSEYLSEIAVLNNAPETSIELVDQKTQENTEYKFTIPAGSFTDPDTGDSLIYNVEQADGSELPAWLTFNTETLTISGIPPEGTPDIQLKVTATDSYGLSVSEDFLLTIEPQYNEISGANNSNVLRGRDAADHIAGNGGNDRLTGGLGNDWLEGGKGNDTLNGNEGSDLLEGGLGADKLFGHAGDDRLSGGAGNDTLYGGDGDDTFTLIAGDNGFDKALGQAGYDQLLGTAADDLIGLSLHTSAYGLELIDGGEGENIISGDSRHNRLDFSKTELRNISEIQGGAGNDTITGSVGDDVIVGGLGNDKLSGGDGDDTFKVATGDGFDRFYGGEGRDTVLAGDGNDQIGLLSHYSSSGLETIDGGAGNNTIIGSSAANRLDFSKTELVNIAAIDGGAGKDFITGTANADVFVGGTGNDRLYGGLGSDEYRFAAGDGQDTVYEHKGSVEGDIDSMLFAQADATDQLWFSRNNKDLVVDVVGSDDSVTVRNWFKADRFQIEQIQIQGSVLGNESVDALVQAMAAFDVPTGAGGVISDEVKQQLQPVLAANWHSL